MNQFESRNVNEKQTTSLSDCILSMKAFGSELSKKCYYKDIIGRIIRVLLLDPIQK